MEVGSKRKRLYMCVEKLGNDGESVDYILGEMNKSKKMTISY